MSIVYRFRTHLIWSVTFSICSLSRHAHCTASYGCPGFAAVGLHHASASHRLISGPEYAVSCLRLPGYTELVASTFASQIARTTSPLCLLVTRGCQPFPFFSS